MTTERIAAAIKPILDEDRRAGRERIAELERDLAALRAHDKATRGAAIAAAIADALRREKVALEGSLRDLRVAALQAQHALVDQDMLIDDLNEQVDELTEKCAALVVENKRLADGKTPILRIDPDMSDPQPGKLLVVRLDDDDMGRAWTPLGEWGDRGRETQNFWPEQRVGFLVETPAVEEKGPWVVYDDPDNLQINPCMGRHGWGNVSEGIGPFDVRSDAVAALDGWRMGGYSKAPRVITLAEARAIEAKR